MDASNNIHIVKQVFFIGFVRLLALRPLLDLLCQPRVIVKMIVEKQMERRLAGETEVLGEHLPHHKISHDQTRV
jgi:hypothetical protein